MRLAPLACSVAGVLALTACGTSTTGSDVTSTQLTSTELDLLTRSGTFARISVDLANAESKLISICMAAKGFRYRAESADPAAESDEERSLNMNERRTRGYGLASQYASEKESVGTAPNDAYLAGLSKKKADAYMKTLRGGATDFREMRFGGGRNITFSARGCEAESRTSLYGSLDDWVSIAYFPQNLNSELSSRVEKSPKYRSAMNDWRTCMRGKGYTYTSPDTAYEQLKDDYRTQGANSALREREIAVAVADGNCGAELHIPTTVLTLRRSHAQSLPISDKLQLRRLTAIWMAAADRAQ
ncbi:hypothetical protein [Streptomyces neyagawaensis]|uniref:hypothetical protein n=1 Tax=Streptomyces neyagawaensis TaxID=42238 RepID=UPI000AAC8C2C|nr:hypothetical protein [Streptomyces neyagawaensis]MCL6735109.1 hypothetical protein [Streptomyces neyagawaensis]MDE1687504.1 hypothetical protein [Streptomyces neyagawaensis]